MVRLVVLLLLVASPASATPPPEVLDALDRAMTVLEDPEQVHSYVVKASGYYEKANGKDRHEFETETRITVKADGDHEVESIRAEHDGEPVEPRSREERQAERQGDEEGGSVSFELLVPAGEDLAKYVYGTPEPDGSLLTATFEPAADAGDEEGLARGRLWWDPRALLPVAVEFEAMKNPRFIQSLSNRAELGATGGVPHLRKLVSEGSGGIPGFRRVFTMEMVIEDVRLAE